MTRLEDDYPDCGYELTDSTGAGGGPISYLIDFGLRPLLDELEPGDEVTIKLSLSRRKTGAPTRRR